MADLYQDDPMNLTYTTTAHAAYLEAELWSGLYWPGEDAEPVPLDSLDSEVSPEAHAATLAEVTDFLTGADEAGLLTGLDPEQVGHDFSLTRNRHGAGFWDRGIGKQGDDLTELAHPYGETNWFLTDTGMLDTDS